MPWKRNCGVSESTTRRKKKRPELGDVVEKALSTGGVTEERVTRWLGRPCGCRRRKEKLNRLSRWVRGVVTGRDAGAAKEEIERMLDS